MPATGPGPARRTPPTPRTLLVGRYVPDQDLLRRRRRVPGGDALHGDPAERRRHAVSRTSRSSRGRFAVRALADLWTSSPLFTGIRQRTSLGGRCGECEMNAHCGGCRARAYGMTGDVMAEDPLCTHTPGQVRRVPTAHARCAAKAGPAEPWRGARREATGLTSSMATRRRRRSRGTTAPAARMKKNPGVRPRHGRQGRRGVVPQERPQPRDRGRTRADPRADADAEVVRVSRRNFGVTSSFDGQLRNAQGSTPSFRPRLTRATATKILSHSERRRRRSSPTARIRGRRLVVAGSAELDIEFFTRARTIDSTGCKRN